MITGRGGVDFEFRISNFEFIGAGRRLWMLGRVARGWAVEVKKNSEFGIRNYRRGEATTGVGVCCPRLCGGGEEEFGIRNSEFGIVGAGRRPRVLGRVARGCAVEVKKNLEFGMPHRRIFRISDFGFRIYRRGEATSGVGAFCPRLCGGGGRMPSWSSAFPGSEVPGSVFPGSAVPGSAVLGSVVSGSEEPGCIELNTQNC